MAHTALLASLLPYQRVWHIGTLRHEDKGWGSHEGSGLSVSLDPEAWRFIARLGGPLFQLEKAGASFVDAYAFLRVKSLLREIWAWCMWECYIERRRIYRIDWYDPELEEWRMFPLLMSQDLPPTNETMAKRRCGAIQCPLRRLIKLMSLDKKGNHTMGWWPVHYDLTTCDCIGDTPADILGDAFQQILAERAKQGQGKPLLREYLDAFAALLQAHGPHLYYRGRWLAVRHIVARIRSADGSLLKEIIGNPFHPSDEELFTQCDHALEGITRAYWEDLGRNPRLREVLTTIEFVLSDEYCSDLLPTQLEEVTAITRRISLREYLCFSLYGLYARILGLFEWW